MGENMMLYDLIIKSADGIIEEQNEDGSFPAGHNGVRFDPETPARNTGDWLITLLKVFSWTGDEKYLAPAKKALDYLLSDEIRPMGATIWHRKNPDKDFCNGLIGQAFSIEALCEAFVVLGSQEARAEAESIFLLHPFHEKVGAWQRVAVDGSYLPYDGTFNHQLCFAAAGAYLYSIGKNIEINRRLQIFMDRLGDTLSIYHLAHRGLIKHPLYTASFHSGGLLGTLRRFAVSLKQYKKKRIKHAVGYHCFNMYAFSLLKRYYPEHKFWKSSKFKKTLDYMMSKEYSHITEAESFSTPYSPAGFETAFLEKAFALEIFSPSADSFDLIKQLVEKQLFTSFDFNTYKLERCTADPITQAARIYKATRLKNIQLDLSLGENTYG